MKKLILSIGFIVLLITPVLASSTTPLEGAISKNYISSKDRPVVESYITSKNELINEMVNKGTGSSNGISKAEVNLTQNNSVVNNVPITYDYDHTFSWQILSNPKLVSTYKQQGSLKSNLISDNCLWVPAIQNGIITNIVGLDKTSNGVTLGALIPVSTSERDIYDSSKIEQLFKDAGITAVRDFQYVNTGRYTVKMAYVNSDKGEYAIPFSGYSGIGLVNGKVYKVSEIIDAIDRNLNLENQDSINSSNLNGRLAGGFGPSNAAPNIFSMAPYISVITGAILLLILILFIYKRHKSNTNS